MPSNRIHYLGAVALVVTVGLAATSGAASAPATGSGLAANSAQASAKIAFVSYRGGGPANHGTVYVVNADGSGQRRLARHVRDFPPAWSPDGRKLAFVRDVGANSEVYVVNADGSGERRLTRNPAGGGFPAWSPDGRKIAFVRGVGGNGEVYVMNADGSGQRNLTRNPADDWFSAWSPDGRKIAFVRSGRCWVCPANDKLYVMNADGSGQRRLARNARGGAVPPSRPSPVSWSPDGRRIAFARGLRPNPKTARFHVRMEVYVMNADGSGQRRLAYGAQPLWSPDGQRIAFVRSGRLVGGLYVMNADGSGQRRLARNARGGAAWSPGPKK